MRHFSLVIATMTFFCAQSVLSQSAVKIKYNNSDESVIVVDPSYSEVELPVNLNPLPRGIKEVSKMRIKDDIALPTHLIVEEPNHDIKIEQQSQFTIGLSDDGPNINLKSAVLASSRWDILMPDKKNQYLFIDQGIDKKPILTEADLIKGISGHYNKYDQAMQKEAVTRWLNVYNKSCNKIDCWMAIRLKIKISKKVKNVWEQIQIITVAKMTGC